MATQITVTSGTSVTVSTPDQRPIVVSSAGPKGEKGDPGPPGVNADEASTYSILS